MTRRLLTSTVLVAILFVLAAQGARAADPARLKTNISTLASERFGGRLTGTDGERLAREFIVAELKRIGAKPLPGQRDFTLPFEFVAGARDGGTTLSIAGKARALSFSDSGEVTGAVVFAGYGIVVPESQDFGYDSYATLDVKDKVVVVLRYFPEDADQKTRAILSRYSDLRFKAMAARQRGAKAVLVVTGPRSPNAGELVPMTFDTALAGSGIVAASIDGQAGNALMAAAGKTLADVQQSLDSGNPHVAGFEIPGTVTVKTRVERERHEAYNIAGYLPATTRVALPKPWLAVGAHYDHLGRGENGSSLASKEEAGRIHGGADDNASGDAAVLASGRRTVEAAAASPRDARLLVGRRTGSARLGGVRRHAAGSDRRPRRVSQLRHGRAHAGQQAERPGQRHECHVGQGWSSRRTFGPASTSVCSPIRTSRPTSRTSTTAGVPCLNFFTGSHGDYHKPSDTADKIDYDDLARIVDFAAAIGRRVIDTIEPPVFAKVEPQTQGGASRAGVRVYTGTVPDYASDAKGLLLGGVVAGGPAEAAGLQKGDVIVEIAGQTIANIYDYTYALDVLKIGQPAKVVYMRAGERKETTLTPSARK